MKQREIMESIENHRRKLGYKQYEFAEMMGLTPVQYSKIKSGRRPLYGTELCQLAAELDMKISTLIAYNETLLI